MITVKKFSADWCAPCKTLAPIMENVKSAIDNVNFENIDVDVNPEQAQKYSIRSVPTIIIESNGREIQRASGVQQAQYYINTINQIKKLYKGI